MEKYAELLRDSAWHLSLFPCAKPDILDPRLFKEILLIWGLSLPSKFIFHSTVINKVSS